MDVEVAVDLLGVVLHRARRQVEILGDARDRASFDELYEYLAFLIGEAKLVGDVVEGCGLLARGCGRSVCGKRRFGIGLLRLAARPLSPQKL